MATEKEIKDNTGNKEVQDKEVVETQDVEQEPLPDEEDASNLLALINEIDAGYGGAGDIAEIIPRLIVPIKALADKLAAAVATFKDPIIESILMDMIEQREDGKEPDAMLAIARNVPVDELEGIEGDDNYDALQEAAAGRIKAREDKIANDNIILDKIDKSMANLETYATENGLDEDRKAKLWSIVQRMIEVFADGEITVEEYAVFDKGGNYDADMAVMKERIPVEPVKEVMPDSAQFAANKTVKKENKKPANTIETLGAVMGSGQQWENVGKRKRTS